VGGAFLSQGHNLSSDSGSGFLTSPGDLINVNPLLGPLQDNGGPTRTHALLPGSPALEAGDNAEAPAYDQRGPGFPRIAGAAIDIGAFEVQPATVLGVVVNDGAPQRSRVTSLTVTFSGGVTFDPGAFELLRQDGSPVGLEIVTSLAEGRTVAVLTFAGGDIL